MFTTESHPQYTRRILVDVSPILYSNLISATNQEKRRGVKPDPITGKISVNKNVVIFLIIEELAKLRSTFNTDEVILAYDNNEGGYWRKQVYDRYKYKRKKSRDDSVVDWENGFKIFKTIRELVEHTSFKIIDVASAEADDISFVLGKYFQDKGGVTMVSLDGDWRLTLQYQNVSLYKTRKTQKLPGIYEELTLEEVLEKQDLMCIQGDRKDGMLHIKSWTQFSDEFLEEYPKYKNKEEELYSKHHQIEHMYNLKHNWEKSAYKHPQYGFKTFKKSKKTIKELLKENNIYKKNYELNKTLCLPENVPKTLQDNIIHAYETASDVKDPAKLNSLFMKHGLFELISQLPFL